MVDARSMVSRGMDHVYQGADRRSCAEPRVRAGGPADVYVRRDEPAAASSRLGGGGERVPEYLLTDKDEALPRFRLRFGMSGTVAGYAAPSDSAWAGALDTLCRVMPQCPES
jgi:hypothetical protein